MPDPVNGLLAARMDPERRRRIGNALLAAQFDRETPQDAPVTDRAGLFPLATYANGQTGIAWPGIIATPFEKMAGVLRGEITPGTPEFNEAGFDIAGAAMVGGLAAARPRGSLGMSGRPTEPQGIRAYHGSPHDFDKFDMSKIGTGEGAQAYGHGLYFAENEAVAQSYKQPLLGMARGQSGADVVARQAMSTSATPEAAIEFIQQTIAHLRKRGPEGEKAIREFYEPAIDIVRSGGKPDGRMYEVNIKASPDDFLDWDKPLSQQSEKVRGAVQALDPEMSPSLRDQYTGQTFVRDYSGYQSDGYAKPNPEFSQALRDAGIPGIKYLDQGSRSTGEGSRNYVVFDANLIEILRKYGLLGMLGAGGMAQELLKPSKPTIPDDAA